MSNVRRIHMSGGEVKDNTQGTLHTWGYNYYGNLGHGGGSGVSGSYANKSTPFQVGSEASPGLWANVWFERYSVITKRADGTLWSWGYNGWGGLGLGHKGDPSSSPAQVGTFNIANGSTGSGFTHFTKTDGTLWGMGYNGGRLGLNSTATQSYSSPVQVGSLSDWGGTTAANGLYLLVHGGSCTFAIKGNGELWTWGQNGNGELGIGTTTHMSSPTQVSSGQTFTTVSGGDNHAGAINSAGSLYTWGANSYGVIGNGSSGGSYNTPVLMGGGTIWEKLSCGSTANYAIRKDGTLWSWGYNSSGALGQGNGTNYSSPVQVGTENNWVQVSGGQNWFGAVNSIGELWTCGLGQHSRTGQGNTTSISSLTQVGSETYWLSVTAGHFMGAAMSGAHA